MEGFLRSLPRYLSGTPQDVVGLEEATESSFSTVRLRQRVKGTGLSRKRGLMMACKLLRMAEERWRRLNGAELLPLVRAGVQFTDGEQVERGTSRPLTFAADLGLDRRNPAEYLKTTSMEFPEFHIS